MKRQILISTFVMMVLCLGSVSAALSGNALLSRPTDTSITFSLLSDINDNVIIEYGISPGNYSSQTSSISLSADVPEEVNLTGLNANTQYFYSIDSGTEHEFQTARPAGSDFVFTISSDSHTADSPRSDSNVYDVTFNNIKDDLSSGMS